NRCIEGDNTGTNRADGGTPPTLLRISNLTCVTSNVDMNAGTNPSSKGDAEGLLFREGAWFELYHSIITSNDLAMASSEWLELQVTEGPETLDAAQAGISVAKSNMIACSEPLKLAPDAANAGFALRLWLAGCGSADVPPNGNSNSVVIDTNLPAMLLDGGVGTRAYRTLDLLTDSAGAQVFDQSGTVSPGGTGQLFDVATV